MALAKERAHMGHYTFCLFIKRTFKIFEAEPPEDVQNEFKKYTGDKKNMTAEELQQFLEQFQGEAEITAEKAEEILKGVVRKRHHFIHRAKDTLNLEDFRDYLFSVDLNPPIRTEVHHDMTAPLSQYFIFTGHNSYLTGNQLTSRCSDVPIIKALEKGVRVVELDLWPKSNEEVHVFHGGTRTPPVELIKCLKSIRENAFKKNPYPVIITLEDHLEKYPKLQEKVAKMLRKTFGDFLFLPDDCSECLKEFPSPEKLKHKILISTKPQQKYEEVSRNNSLKGKCWQLCSQLSSTFPPFLKCGSPALRKEQSDQEDKFDDKTSESGQEDYDYDNGDDENVKYKDLIAIHAGKPKGGLDAALEVEQNKVRRLSLSEQQVIKVIKSHATDAVRFTQKNILRIYPKGTRIDSSNYNPMLAWTLGAQMVAFNMQCHDRHLRLMQGMFRANGGCGYVKKPNILSNFEPVLFDPEAKSVKPILKVKVYMGDGWNRHFRRTAFDFYSPPDFYTKLSIEGVPVDKKENTMQKTGIVKNNWTPVWNEEFTIKLTVPELALLRVEVFDDDGATEKDDFAGQTCLPVSELKTGIRAVPLFDKKGEQYEHARLLMRFTFT